MVNKFRKRVVYAISKVRDTEPNNLKKAVGRRYHLKCNIYAIYNSIVWFSLVRVGTVIVRRTNLGD